ncbi:hypothetical protein ACTI_67740 [Actinoplanes sp. OR16]|uniref:zf-HC2 domain-containing protein n=1 Tax=Actinoplanes sp. OR16 TaxID=946334 RepID=UPI000F6E450E|nr:zf-HC2 domain-containing protein [Actinoplanes sp. OR16]BBH70089.1 hypothetical protein ACTI_67740 [Actinoplanes sp. OR16]
MTPHPAPAVIARYADREAPLDEVTMWSVEVHLEDCADCRAVLADGMNHDLLDRLKRSLDEDIEAGPAPAPRRRRQHWMVWHLVPWVIMSVAVLACAGTLQVLQPSLPSLVALVAPIAPLPAVAVAWSRRHDPAWELIAGTPAAGLAMLLRRTAGVLAVIVPALTVAGSRTGLSLALALLPCLAFTAATIALGAVIGVRRAAIGLGAAWTLAAIVPAVLTAQLPPMLHQASSPAWALLTILLAGFAATRATAFTRLTSHD